MTHNRTAAKTAASARNAAAYAALRAEVIAAYGGICTCPGCGEWRTEFLSAEHRHGRRLPDGTRDAKTGKALYRQVKKAGFPDAYTILCMNCNHARGRLNSGGLCPHERERAGRPAAPATT
jgi:hypothetical protein